jgi:hypothetical protein
MPKRPHPDSAWCLEFPACAHLTAAVQAISHLDGKITIRSCDGFVQTQAVASSKSCMVTAKLACATSGGEVSVCMDATTLLRTLRACHKTQPVTLRQSDDAVVLTSANEDGIDTMQWTLPTIVDDQFNVELDAMNYDGEWVYQTAGLKQDLRRCRDMESGGLVTLRLLGHTEETRQLSCVELESSGDRGSVTLRHFSSTDETACGAVEDAGVGPMSADSYTKRFEQVYNTNAFIEFLKAIDLPTVKLLLGKDKPLIVEATLACDGSVLNFVQGPHDTE